jgi:glycosyltransferase involved in cell wall biosynthesis
MRLLFVADGRSAIAINWIHGLVERGHDVHLVSSFPCVPILPFASFQVIPIAFSGLKGSGQLAASSQSRSNRSALVKTKTLTRQWLGPLTFHQAARRLRTVIDQVQPDLIHALRIPYEGMVSALALESTTGTPRMVNQTKLLISIWGNDFTLHAPANPWLGHYTRQALHRANAIHADCFRDIRLARAWGALPNLPWAVLPGGGGVQSDLFHPSRSEMPENTEWRVVNPRGVRAYVLNEPFFRAIPLVLRQQPHTRFLCPAMAGDSQVISWIQELGIGAQVDLLPAQTRPEMAHLFRQAQVLVSPTTHDGTPNTLLEAMACGCLPVVGDLESLREWITPGINGLVVDPTDSQSIAQVILLGLENPGLRQRARQINLQAIAERAEYTQVMDQITAFYQRI